MGDIGAQQTWISRTFETHKFIAYNSNGRKVGTYVMDRNQPMVYIENRFMEALFVNDMATDVNILWINLDDKGKPRVPMGAIAPGQSFNMNTFVKHAFEFEYTSQPGGIPERRKYVA